MTNRTVSGTLGDIQLMAFTAAANANAVNEAAKELGCTRTHVVTGTAVDATAYLREHASPEILLVDISTADDAPGELDKLADVVNPHTKVVVSGKVDSIRFYQWLNDLGIAGYLLQPFSAGELKQAIAKGNTKKSEAAGGEDVIKKLIAVVGARGGVGTSTLAANIAAIFAREYKLSTALVDLDAYFGTAALSFDLDPARGVRDAFEKPDRVDALFLERVMVKPFDNLSLFATEEPLIETLTMQANAGEMIFAAMQEKFNVVVVDVPRQMNPMTRHVLAHAHHTLIVAEPQITSLRDSLRVKDYVVDHLKRPLPWVLLNRVGISSGNELSVKEFSKNFGHEVTAQVPFLHEAIAATAQGELMAHTQKLAPAQNSLRKVAQAIIGKEASKVGKPKARATAPAKEKASGGSLLGRLAGKK